MKCAHLLLIFDAKYFKPIINLNYKNHTYFINSKPFKMKKSLILIFVVLGYNLSLYSQSPDWLWAKAVGGIGGESGTSVKVDNRGNSYVTGYFDSPLIIGSDTLDNKGSGDIFLLKYDSKGNVLWAKSAGGNGYDYASCLALDSNGNCYITGYFRSSIIGFDSLTITKTSGGQHSDLFIVKYDSSGYVKWAKSAHGDSEDDSRSIWVENNGDFYITGSFYSSSIYFDTIQLTNNYHDYADFYIAKYNTLGKVKWVKSAVGNHYDFGNSVSVDHSGNCYVTGNFNSTSIIFDSLTLTNTTAGEFANLFIVKYDSSGNALWVKSTQGTSDAHGESIWAEGNGNLYISGSFYSSSINFDTINLTNHSYNKADLFIAKHNALGDVVWAKSAGGEGDDNSSNITADESGNLYITGDFGSSSVSFDNYNLINSDEYDDMFIVKYNSNGNVNWAKSAGGYYYDFGTSLSIDPDGFILHTGCFYENINFSPTTLISNGQYDFFLAKINASVNEIEDKSSNNQFTIFPNPTDDRIYIKTNEGEIGKVYIVHNTLGKEVKRGKIESEITIVDLSNLSEGFYLIGIGDHLKQKIIIHN